MDAPAWIVLDPTFGPTCTRCGVVWDRGHVAALDAVLAASGHKGDSAVLRALWAFLGEHESCGDEGQVYHPVTLAMVEAVPVCPDCGRPFKHIHHRRCYSCHPCATGAILANGTSSCRKCGRPYHVRQRCYICSPTPLMLRFPSRVGKA
jgi:hypothetical protein